MYSSRPDPARQPPLNQSVNPRNRSPTEACSQLIDICHPPFRQPPKGATIFAAQINHKPQMSKPHPSNADFRQQIVRNINRKVSLVALAREMGMTLTQFKQQFHSTFGAPPHRWMTLYRTLLAHSMLLEGDKPIAQIAHECGFGSSSLLIRHFRKTFGIPPQKYRQLHNHRQTIRGLKR